MQSFQNTFETCKRSFISVFSNCMTVPLKVTSTIRWAKILKISHLGHRLSFFYYIGKLCSVFRYPSFSIFTIPWFTKSITSLNEYYYIRQDAFLNISFEPQPTSLQTYPIGRYKIWRAEDKSDVLFNLATCSNCSIANSAKIPIKANYKW